MERVSGRPRRLDRRRHFDGLRRGAVGRRQAFGPRRAAAARPRLRAHDDGRRHRPHPALPDPQFLHGDGHRAHRRRHRTGGDRLDPVAIHGHAAAVGGGQGDDRRRAGAGGRNPDRLKRIVRRRRAKNRRPRAGPALIALAAVVRVGRDERDGHAGRRPAGDRDGHKKNQKILHRPQPAAARPADADPHQRSSLRAVRRFMARWGATRCEHCHTSAPAYQPRQKVIDPPLSERLMRSPQRRAGSVVLTFPDSDP